MTARYRALAPLYVGKLIHPGEEFSSELPPGRNWSPLNADAERKCAERDATRGKMNAEAAKLDARPPAPGAVEIPEDWSEASKAKRMALARKLGAPSTVKAEEADSFIEAELERRSQGKAA